MAVWRNPAVAYSVAPAGDACYLQFEIVGLPDSFVINTKGPNASEVVFRVWQPPKPPPDPLPGEWKYTFIGIVGWRFDESQLRVYKRTRTVVGEFPASGRLISAQRTPDGTWVVRVFFRLTADSHIAMGSPFRTLGTTGDLVPLYIQEIRRVTIGAAEHAFLRLVDASGLNPDELSPTMTFTTSSSGGANLAVAGMNLGPSAFGVGSFPGYNRNCSPEGGKPRLQFHWDSQSERCWMFSQNAFPATPPAIPILHDIRLNSTNMAAVAGREAELVLASGAIPANTGYPSALFGVTTGDVYTMQSPGFTIQPNASTLGAVFRLSPSPATNAIQTIMGRFNGSVNNQRQWRFNWFPIAADMSTSQIRVSFSTGTAIVNASAVIGVPLTNHMVVYRGTSTAAEFWINGKRQTVTLPSASVPVNAYGPFTLGARDNSGTSTPSWTEPFRGHLEQAFVYDEAISDGALSLLLFESCRRAGIIQRSPVDSGWKQPYSEDATTEPPTPPVAPEVRRLDRKPIAVITLMVDRDRAYELPEEETNNILGQRSEWRNKSSEGAQDQIMAYLTDQVTGALMGSDDFDIMFNRPAGQYADDIIASGIFGYVNTFTIDGAISDAPEKVILDVQWAAMRDVWDLFRLSDHNDRGTDESFFGSGYARRCWFYTGGGMTLDDAGNTLQNARMFSRIVPPATASLYKSDILDNWTSIDDRFRCLFLDSMNQDHAYARFAELLHDASIYDNFTLVGEPINALPASDRSREVAPSFSMAGLPSAIWWKASVDGRPARAAGYDPDWATSDRWDRDTMAVYFGVGINDELDLTNTDTGANGAVSGDDNMRFGDIYRFCTYGLIPVAWGGNYAKIGAAWDYASGRIPVGRVPMLSPRISRVWR